jgi:calcineurin-like phosphoesterase family protein
MSASNPFFSADWHLGHARCIQYCNRPFQDAHEMNKTIIERWNEKVGKDDHAYFLGDASFSSLDSTVSMLQRMNGRKFGVLGNHDRRIMEKQSFLDCFESVKWYDVIYVQDKEALEGRQVIVLMHFPLLSWERSRYGSWHLHGHCVDLSTEILTEDGWKHRHEINTEMRVVTYNDLTKKLEMLPIQSIVDYENFSGKVYHFAGKGIDLRVTDKHTIIHFGRQNINTAKVQAESADNFFAKGKRATVLRSGILEQPGLDWTDEILKLYIILAADGSSIKNDTGLARIIIKRSRKISYVREILNQASVAYKELKQTNQGMTSFNFYLPEQLKNVSIKGLDRSLLKCNYHQFKCILEAYGHSDGSINGKGIIIYSAKKEEMDLLQELSVRSGHSATLHKRNHGYSGKLQYQLSVYPNTHVTHHFNKADYEYVSNEHFWCIKCPPNENFFMRRNGKVHLTGNCHGNIQNLNKSIKRMDVGVDTNNFYPYSYQEIKEIMKSKTEIYDP